MWVRISERRRVCVVGFWHIRYMAQVRAEAVVSWPAARKVIMLLTSWSSVKALEARAVEIMSWEPVDLPAERDCRLVWIRRREVSRATAEAARTSSLRLMGMARRRMLGRKKERRPRIWPARLGEKMER